MASSATKGRSLYLQVKMKHQKVISFILYIAAAGLLFYAGFLSWQYWKATSTGDLFPTAGVVTYSTDHPSERIPSRVDSDEVYTVDHDQPRVLSIPAIGVSSYVQQVGIDQYGHIAVPTNVHFTGWFVESAAPGQPGVTLIDGHVGGRYGGAVFSSLSKLAIGEEIRLQKGDLSWLTYRVETVFVADPGDTAAIYKQYTDAHSELHLITCDGVYIPASRSYDARLVVIAGLIDQ